MPESKAPARDILATAEDFVLARTALLDITVENTIGERSGSKTEADGALTVYFDATMTGYPGWKWTVSLAHVKGSEPSVLETELTPGDGALLSPEWVPWSERLADYKEALAAAGALEGADDSDDDADDTDDDTDIDDDEAFLYSGDLDGVDIDSLDESDGADAAADTVGESAPPTVRDDKAKKTERQSDDAGPQPAGQPRRNQRSKKQQQDEQGE